MLLTILFDPEDGHTLEEKTFDTFDAGLEFIRYIKRQAADEAKKEELSGKPGYLPNPFPSKDEMGAMLQEHAALIAQRLATDALQGDNYTEAPEAGGVDIEPGAHTHE